MRSLNPPRRKASGAAGTCWCPKLQTGARSGSGRRLAKRARCIRTVRDERTWTLATLSKALGRSPRFRCFDRTQERRDGCGQAPHSARGRDLRIKPLETLVRPGAPCGGMADDILAAMNSCSPRRGAYTERSWGGSGPGLEYEGCRSNSTGPREPQSPDPSRRRRATSCACRRPIHCPSERSFGSTWSAALQAPTSDAICHRPLETPPCPFAAGATGGDARTPGQMPKPRLSQRIVGAGGTRVGVDSFIEQGIGQSRVASPDLLTGRARHDPGSTQPQTSMNEINTIRFLYVN